jgi:hypothetical protein
MLACLPIGCQVYSEEFYTLHDVQRLVEDHASFKALTPSPRMLQNFTRLLLLVAESQLGAWDTMRAYCDDLRDITWATGCSGAETPKFVFDALQPELQRAMYREIQFQHSEREPKPPKKPPEGNAPRKQK